MNSDDDKPLTIEQARAKLAKGLKDLEAGIDSGPITFRLKPTKKRGEKYLLKLTPLQRESLLRCKGIKAKIRKQMRDAGDGTLTMGVTLNELSHLNDEVGKAAVYTANPDKRRLLDILRRISNLFTDDHVGLFDIDPPSPRRKTPKKSHLLYQFKITLLNIKPAIWRRIQVPDCTLGDLHENIQKAFGWWNCHLHQFQIDGERYSLPATGKFDLGDEFLDETQVLLSQLIPKSGQRARWNYEYDFGDGWRHEVLFEGLPPKVPKAKYPLCVEGERACPPEDCGGPFGYVNYLEAIANPKHKEHKEMLKWRGKFNPEEFDAQQTTAEMREPL
jgi:hypothetical protein